MDEANESVATQMDGLGAIAMRQLGERLGIADAETLPLDRLMSEIEGRDSVGSAMLRAYMEATGVHAYLVESESAHGFDGVVTLAVVRALLRKRAAWLELRRHLGS